MKKRPLFITIISLSLLYFPLKCIWRFIYAYFKTYWHHSYLLLTKIYYALYVHPLVAVTLLLIPLIIILGLMRLKKWAYFLLLFFSIGYFVRLIYSLIERLLEISSLGPQKFLFIGSIVFKLAYFLAITIYLSRPKVRDLFK